MSYFMGIDLGTSSLKAVIINETGTVVEISGSSYSVICRKTDMRNRNQRVGGRR